jgi:hypothetical protein
MATVRNPSRQGLGARLDYDLTAKDRNDVTAHPHPFSRPQDVTARRHDDWTEERRGEPLLLAVGATREDRRRASDDAPAGSTVSEANDKENR